MYEVIKVKSASFEKYKELILKRDALKKDAFNYEINYIREFGDAIIENFKLKMECIKKKKTIEYCQMAINHGQKVDAKKLQEYLQKELDEFKKQLNDMLKDNKNAKDSRKITEHTALKIKKIYHKLVKKIHPDINPKVAENEALQRLWQQLVLAYNCSNLELMEETEALIYEALEKMGEDLIFAVPNVDEKIAKLEDEIRKIIATDPYQYKFLLANKEVVEEKKKSLEEEKKSYEDYLGQLDEILDSLLENEVSLFWQMN